MYTTLFPSLPYHDVWLICAYIMVWPWLDLFSQEANMQLHDVAYVWKILHQFAAATISSDLQQPQFWPDNKVISIAKDELHKLTATPHNHALWPD